jgi:hypothetical protein
MASGCLPPLFDSTWAERRGGAMADGGEAPSSAHSVPNSDLILPERSRRLGFFILLTFGSENDRRKARDDGAVQPTLGGGMWLPRWSSDDENRLNRLLTSPSCSSVLQSQRTTTNWTRMGRTPWWLGFGSCGSKFRENRPLCIGLLVWTHRELGVL